MFLARIPRSPYCTCFFYPCRPIFCGQTPFWTKMNNIKKGTKDSRHMRNNRKGRISIKGAQQWDWALDNVKLGKKHGISRERVRQIRLALGIAPAITSTIFSAAKKNRQYFKTHTQKEIAARFGLKRSTLKAFLHKYKFPYKAAARGAKTALNWKRVDWSQSPKLIAQKLGCKIDAVYKRRSRIKMQKQPARHKRR